MAIRSFVTSIPWICLQWPIYLYSSSCSIAAPGSRLFLIVLPDFVWLSCCMRPWFEVRLNGISVQPQPILYKLLYPCFFHLDFFQEALYNINAAWKGVSKWKLSFNRSQVDLAVSLGFYCFVTLSISIFYDIYIKRSRIFSICTSSCFRKRRWIEKKRKAKKPFPLHPTVHRI